MGFRTYRAVLGIRDVRRVLLLGLVIRIPLWASSVILTLHVVTHLHRSYGAAGLLAGVATVTLAISAPWRGRRLDRVGLRRAVAPSLAVLAACWSVAPFLGYWPLLVLAAVAGLFVVPTFSIVRQVLLHRVSEQQRTTALAIDSVAVEISFMIGPALGVLLATYAPTSWAMFTCEFATIAGGAVLWLVNPAVSAAREDDEPARRSSLRSWVTTPAAVTMLAAMAATVVLTGTDVGVVAALRDMHHQSWIGWQLAVWGVGSAIGGVVFGAMSRPPPLPALLGLLAVTAAPLAIAPNAFVLAGLLFVTGCFCAPTITSSVDAMSRVVRDTVRGEALGWHGSAMTLGSALGAPIAGYAIDRIGWGGGFAVPAVLALALAVVCRQVLPGRATAASPEADLVDAAT